MKILLTEGGNIFDEAQRINKIDVLPTVQWLETVTGLNLVDHMLGTTGKKETSGDLDLGVKEEDISKEKLVDLLTKWAIKHNIPQNKIFNVPKTKAAPAFKHGWIFMSGSNVHFKTPINGDPQNGYVQTDFMFTPDMSWTTFSMAGTPEANSPFKGVDKHVLLSKLTKLSNPNRMMSWSYLNGLLDSNTREVISKQPDEIAKLVLGPTATRNDITSVESILRYIKKNNLLDKFKKGIEDFRNERKFSEDDINKILAESKFPSFKQFFIREQLETLEVGFFPGAFKPVHVGHLKAIKDAAEKVNGPFFVVVSKGVRSSKGGMKFDLEKTLELFKIYKPLLPDNVHVVTADITPLATVLQVLVILNNGRFTLGKTPKNADPNLPPPDPESLVKPQTREIVSKIPNAQKYLAKLAVGDDLEDLTRYKNAFADERYIGRKLSAELIETLKGWSATIFRNGLEQLDRNVIQEYIPLAPKSPEFKRALEILYGTDPRASQAVNLFKTNK